VSVGGQKIYWEMSGTGCLFTMLSFGEADTVM